MGFLLQHPSGTPTDVGGSQDGHGGGCPSPIQGGDCAAHLDTGSRCGRQGIRHVWFAAGMGGDTAALVSAPAGRSEPPVTAAASSSPRQEVWEPQHQPGGSGTKGLGSSGTKG